jgi:hypothetical protein
VFHHTVPLALSLATVATGFALLAADFAAPPGLGHRVSFRVSLLADRFGPLREGPDNTFAADSRSRLTVGKVS